MRILELVIELQLLINDDSNNINKDTEIMYPCEGDGPLYYDSIYSGAREVHINSYGNQVAENSDEYEETIVTVTI